MSRRTAPGFTLVEMIVSLAIGSLILVLAALSLRSIGEGYERGTDGVAAEREARALLTLAAEDLGQAVSGSEMAFGNDDGVWRKERLGFLCLQPDDAQTEDERLGDLCAVIYYVRDLEIGGETVRCLMRGFRGSQETFAALREDAVPSLYAATEADEPVAFGVVAFEVDPLLRRADGEWDDWLAAADPEWSGPDAVRMRLIVARRELVGKLNSADDWDASPLLGNPKKAGNSSHLQVYEVVHPFGHAS